jgi:hypothetical protein
MRAWHAEASTIERTECTLSRAQGELADLERQASELEAKGRAADAAAIKNRLRPLVLVLRGDPRDPGHVNLPGRVNWLTIQVGNNSGRPTKAQSEWIRKFADDTQAAVKALADIRAAIAGR